MKARWIVVAVFLAVWVARAKAQFVMTVSGAPFSATWISTLERAGQIETKKAVAARASDGSVYRATYKNGTVDWIEINDVPHEKLIIIYPLRKMYTETTAPGGKWFIRTPQQEHSVLERWNIDYIRQATNQDKTSTSLGVKTESGMTLYGHHYVRTKNKVVTMVGDSWDSDLGFTFSSRTEIPSEQSISTLTLTEINRVEPDSSLFTVPSGYTLNAFPNPPGRASLSSSCDGTSAPVSTPLPANVAGVPCPLPPPYSTARQQGSKSGSPSSGDSYSDIGEPQLGSPPPHP